jgi:serine/threonine-protein kinase
MPFCQECGAEYAPNDLFCNFCGIALKPIVVAQKPLVSEKPVVEKKPIIEETPAVKDTPPLSAPINQVEIPTLVTPPLEEELQNRDVKESVIIAETASPVVQPSKEFPSGPAVQAPEERVAQPSKLAVESSQQETLIEPVRQEPVVAAQEPSLSPIASKKEVEVVSVVEPEKSPSAGIPIEPVSVTKERDFSSPVSDNVKGGALVAAVGETPPATPQAQPIVSPIKDFQPAEPVKETPQIIEPVVKVQEVQERQSKPKAEPVIEPKVVEQQPAKIQEVKKEKPQPLDETAAAVSSRIGVGRSTGDKRPAIRQLREGTILNGRYEIVRRVGGGGMGAVYLAKDRNLGGAPRAVKEMLQAHLDEAQQHKAIEDFKRESLLLTSLEHPSIPTIYDYFYDEFAGRFYLVMKYISGGDISGHLRKSPSGKIDELSIARWGMEIADVLDYLHNRNPPIIYRDLKPANLMVDSNTGRIMLIDFGIARWVNKEEKGVTAVGTMGYAPPELFSGKVEPRSDIYSLGATMFHLLTGTDPQDNPLLIFDFSKHPTPRHINPAMSVEMELILMRAVEYKPENRFRSAAEMRDTLRLHLDKLGRGELTFTPISASQRFTDTASSSVEMVFCGFCGGRIAADDLYCAHCGKPQPLAGASIGVSTTLRPRATAKLVVAGTTEIVASEFLLQKDTNLVGRSDPQANIFPEVDLTRYDPDTKISRRHARIWRQGETFLVEDLGSVNGTVIFNRSDKPVRLAPHQPQVLQNGDRLRLGETLLHFLVN